MDGAYRLSWRERIGFCSGEFALNIIYQTVSFWLLFFYTNVFGLRPEVAAVMFLVVRIVDVVWDPVVGTLVDKAKPRWGKYRSWLILGGIPLAGAAILCFWNGFSGSLLYAYITYVGLSMSFTLISVPYGAMHSSMTRDNDEITILNSVRMICANLAAIAIKALPLVIAIFAPKIYNPTTGRTEAVYNTPEAAGAWFITMGIFMKAGMALGGMIPGLVLAWVGFKSGNSAQTPLAEQGITSLETIVPAILMILAALVISRYELSDARMDEINTEIEPRQQI